MKALKTLIRLGQKNIDKLILEKKSCLHWIASMNNQLDVSIVTLEKEISEHTSSEYAVFLEKYIKVSKENIDVMRLNIKKAEAKLEEINTRLLEAFAELKRFEIILATKKKDQDKAELAEEIKNFDEMNIMRFKPQL